ncbi:MAG: heme ABC transporter ATP-binding protein [Pseudomonadota bacterium]|nr:heme ABC transporter ATP-binding protein [Pseudomonadota bacterium]
MAANVSNNLITASGLSVRRGTSRLLNEVSVRLDAGEMVMIVGPNGAGKTTLLRCLSGELPAEQGEIRFANRPLGNWKKRDLARVRAVLPQRFSLNFPFTVLEVVLLGRSPQPGTHAENLAIAREILERTGIDDLEQRRYTTLSGGEQQRVQIARVLAQISHPAPGSDCCLLLDEPVSALDLTHQHGLFRQLREMTEAGHTGVFCTLHDLNLAALYGDRVVLLDDGGKVAAGPPGEVLSAERIEEVYRLPVRVVPHPAKPDTPLIIPG